MLGKILGVDINEDFITAVQVTGGLHGYQITACAAVELAAADDPGPSLAKVFAQVDPKGAVCLSSIAAAHCSFRHLALPFKDLKKISQTIAFELEPQLAMPIEEQLLDFTVVDQAAGRTGVLAAAVNREFLAGFLALFKPHALDPDVLEVRGAPLAGRLLKWPETVDNGLLLDIGRNRCTLVLFLNRRLALIRDLPFEGAWIGGGPERDVDPAGAENSRLAAAFAKLHKSAGNTLNAFAAQIGRAVKPDKLYITGRAAIFPGALPLLGRFFELPVELVDLRRAAKVQIDKNIAGAWNPALMDNALALALREGKPGTGFNFRKEEFEVGGSFFRLKKEIRPALVLTAVFLLLLAVDFGVDYRGLRSRYEALDKQLSAIFTQTFPEVTRIVDPVQQMRVKIKELKKTAVSFPGGGSNQKVIDLLTEISAHIPKSLDVNVTRMTIDQGDVQIRGKTDTFNTVDSIKKGLEAIDFFQAVAISSANLDQSGKGVQFEIRLQRKEI